jgi:hypothetical protein
MTYKRENRYKYDKYGNILIEGEMTTRHSRYDTTTYDMPPYISIFKYNYDINGNWILKRNIKYDNRSKVWRERIYEYY